MALLAEVNQKMVDQCRALLSRDDDACFQVAETIMSALIGDVNLFASAAKLRSKHHIYRGKIYERIILQMPKFGPDINFCEKILSFTQCK